MAGGFNSATRQRRLNERGRQLRRLPYSNCAFFFYGLSAGVSAAIFEPSAALS
jgi:hypothetical protein